MKQPFSGMIWNIQLKQALYSACRGGGGPGNGWTINHMKTLSSFWKDQTYENPYWKSYWNPYWNPYENHIENHMKTFSSFRKDQTYETHIENHIETHIETFFIQRFILNENIIGLQGAALRSALMELMKAKAIFVGCSRLGPWWRNHLFSRIL